MEKRVGGGRAVLMLNGSGNDSRAPSAENEGAQLELLRQRDAGNGERGTMIMASLVLLAIIGYFVRNIHLFKTIPRHRFVRDKRTPG